VINDLAVGGLAVIDSKSVIRGNFSASDASALLSDPDKWPCLLLSVSAYLKANSPHSIEIVSVPVSAKLVDVVNLLTDKKIHRIWVTDDSKHPVGVITCTDVLDIFRWSLEGAELTLKGGQRRISLTEEDLKEGKDSEESLKGDKRRINIVKHPDYISIGDDNSALYLDRALNKGFSRPTAIFGNPSLTVVSGKDGRFTASEVECWGFQ